MRVQLYILEEDLAAIDKARGETSRSSYMVRAALRPTQPLPPERRTRIEADMLLRKRVDILEQKVSALGKLASSQADD